MKSYIKLPIGFDVTKLKADHSRLSTSDWIAHFNTYYYEGDWSVVPLRSIGGISDHIYPDPAKTEFEDTAILSRCPYYQEVLATFKCPLLSARLLRLGAGSSIREHQDFNLGYEDGEIRFHIPVLTNPGVEFYLDGERIAMNEGECWYLNFNLHHKVQNNGNTDRVHLVIDCVVNEWVDSLLLA